MLRAIGSGCQDRINRHDRTMVGVYCSPRRLYDKIQRAAARGAIHYHCRNCGVELDYRTVNVNNRETRYCSRECRL